MRSPTNVPCRNLSSPRNAWTDRKRTSRCTPDSVWTVICLRAGGPGDDCLQGGYPSWRHHCGKSGLPTGSPPRLPCSQSDIHLAIAVTDNAGGLLHHLFTHHLQADPQRGWPDGWSVLCCSCRQGCPCLDLLFRPVTSPTKGRESGSSSGTNVPATVPLLARNHSHC